ncbi:MAG: NAD-dependent epimerase/dehydratase family protein [Solirubrobacteraceae bacterium]|nr:NAD-dependent epimerase/dehydratase family protein [Solirubrobacteraceae bacterium]
MKIVVTGATGNVGTATLRALVADDSIDEIVGIARRTPAVWAPHKVRWVAADVSRDDLVPHFEGADAVVHLAWLLQPSRDQEITDRANIHGSRRVFEAAAQAGVGALIYASSVAAYSPASPDAPVDESYPTFGIPGSYYSRQKVSVERILDGIERDHPELRVARARPGLIFQRSAAASIRRYFAGPLLPGWAVRRSLIPIVPRLTGLAGQLVHSDDVGELYRLLCVTPDARGAYNVATQPPLDADALAHLLGARPVRLPVKATRAAIKLSYLARLHPVSPDWLDVGLNVPLMKTDRAREELGWSPVHDSGETLLELMEGLRANAGGPTPVLDAEAGGPLRIQEFLTGVGGPNPLDKRA